MNRVFLFLGMLLGLFLGWFMAINYSISVIDRRHSVMTIEDWSRLKDVRDQLSDDKILFF